MHIRAANLEDYEQILRIEKENFPGYPLPRLTFESIVKNFSEGAKVAEQRPRIIERSKVIGHINFELHRRRRIPPPFKHYHEGCEIPKWVYLNAWSVSKQYQGKGIGSALFDELKRIAEENCCVGIYLALKIDHPNPNAYWNWMKGDYIKKTISKWEEKPDSIVDVVILQKLF